MNVQIYMGKSTPSSINKSACGLSDVWYCYIFMLLYVMLCNVDSN